MKIGVLSHSQKSIERPYRHISKNAAVALVRRLLAVQVTNRLIRMVEVRQVSNALPAQIQVRKWAPAVYEHHIEPRLERLTIADSPWLAYLEGLYEPAGLE
jgi:hypothetical protein